MLYRSLTLMLSIALVLFSGTLRGEQWGDLTGRFVYDGEPPPRQLFPLSKDAVCLTEPVFDESLLVGESGGVKNIVVYVHVAPGEDPPPVHPSYAERAEDDVLLLAKDCQFAPRVALMRTSQTLVMRNLDDLGHRPIIRGFRNEQLGLVLPNKDERSRRFPLEEPVPLPISCSIHPWMSGWLLVRDSPYFAVTDEQGRFTIRDLPEGTWTFQFWHEKAGYLKQVIVDGENREWPKGRARFSIEPGVNDPGIMLLSPETFQ